MGKIRMVVVAAAAVMTLSCAQDAAAQIPVPPLPSLPIPLPGAPVTTPAPVAPLPTSFALDVPGTATEDVNFAVTLTYSRPDSSPQSIVVHSKPAGGGAACAATPGADTGTPELSLPTTGDLSTTLRDAILIDDPGTYLLCGWLLEADGSVVRTSSHAVDVRIPSSSLSIGAPASAGLMQTVPLSLTGTSEVQRDVAVTLRSAPGGEGCAATLPDELARGGARVLAGSIVGEQTLTANAPGPAVAGRQLLCAYLGESFDDPAPESVATATLDAIGPTACALGQAALAQQTADAVPVAAATAVRAAHVTAASDRVTIARRAATKAKGRKAMRVAESRLRAARALVAEQTLLATQAGSVDAAAQAALVAQRTATARLCA